jgi:hypothetical protein
MPSFSLADLIPEPIVYVDDTFGGDGQRYDMRTMQMFSSEDFGAYNQLQREVDQAQALMQSKGVAQRDPSRVQKAMQQMLRIIDEMLLILMPDFPRERLEKIPTWGKQKIITRWRAAQKAADVSAEPTPVGEAEPPAPQAKTPRGKRSPASATTTEGRR